VIHSSLLIVNVDCHGWRTIVLALSKFSDD